MKGITVHLPAGDTVVLPPESNAHLLTPTGGLIELQHVGSGTLSLLEDIVHEGQELTAEELQALAAAHGVEAALEGGELALDGVL